MLNIFWKIHSGHIITHEATSTYALLEKISLVTSIRGKPHLFLC